MEVHQRRLAYRYKENRPSAIESNKDVDGCEARAALSVAAAEGGESCPSCVSSAGVVCRPVADGSVAIG
jgi:hypothetical protein